MPVLVIGLDLADVECSMLGARRDGAIRSGAGLNAGDGSMAIGRIRSRDKDNRCGMAGLMPFRWGGSGSWRADATAIASGCYCAG